MARAIAPRSFSPAHQNARRQVVGARKLFASLVYAQKSGLITISVNAARLNRPGSPVWNRDENIAPLAALFSIAFLAFFANVLVGAGVTVLAALIYAYGVRAWILTRVSRRAMVFATASLRGWETLWRNGGLALRDTVRGSACRSPRDDWRGFVTANLPIVVLEPAENRRVLDFSQEGAPVVPSARTSAYADSRARHAPRPGIGAPESRTFA